LRGKDILRHARRYCCELCKMDDGGAIWAVDPDGPRKHGYMGAH